MTKALLLVVFLLHATQALNAQSADANADVISKMVEKAWTRPPEFIDIKLKVRVVKRARSEEEIRRALTQSFVDYANDASRDHGFTGKGTTPSLQQKIDAALKTSLEKEGQPKLYFQRYRAVGTVNRIDLVQQAEATWGPTDSFDETRINGTRNADGTLNVISTNYKQKSTTLDTTHNRPMLADFNYREMIGLEPTLQSLIRASTGRPIPGKQKSGHGESVYDLIEKDQGKLAAFIRGDSTLRPTVLADQLNGKPVIRIDFTATGVGSSMFSVYCDSKTSVTPIMTIVRNRDGKTVRRLETADFDADGFPHYWKQTVVVGDGIEEHEERVAVGVDFQNKPGAEVFEFQVPNKFLGASIYKDKVIFQYPDGRVEERANQESASLPPPAAMPRSRLVMINFWILMALGFAASTWTLIRRRRASKQAR